MTNDIKNQAINKNNTAELISTGIAVLKHEGQSILNLVERLNKEYIAACNLIMSCKGKLVLIGVGKSGHIARKMSATFASTGTPAFFVHAGEASHGDIGMLSNSDVVIALSNSGTTEEVISIVPIIKKLNIPLIAITGAPGSQLAKLSDIHINVSVDKEACPLGLAPTASTTATLAMGDALAISVLQAKNFSKEDFAKSHPGGKLGKQLLLTISDIMHKDKRIPKVKENDFISDAIIEMSNKRLGMTTIVQQDNPQKILGIFTDGDLRRVLTNNTNIKTTKITDVMTSSFVTIEANVLAITAIPIMEKHKIFTLAVINKDQELIGAFNMHDLLQAGII